MSVEMSVFEIAFIYRACHIWTQSISSVFRGRIVIIVDKSVVWHPSGRGGGTIIELGDAEAVRTTVLENCIDCGAVAEGVGAFSNLRTQGRIHLHKDMHIHPHGHTYHASIFTICPRFHSPVHDT